MPNGWTYSARGDMQENSLKKQAQHHRQATNRDGLQIEYIIGSDVTHRMAPREDLRLNEPRDILKTELPGQVAETGALTSD